MSKHVGAKKAIESLSTNSLFVYLWFSPEPPKSPTNPRIISVAGMYKAGVGQSLPRGGNRWCSILELPGYWEISLMPKMALVGNKDVNPARDSVYIISFTPLFGPSRHGLLIPP